MKVRVFIPSRDEGYTHDGSEYEFASLPRVGETIRFTDFRAADFTVTQVGYIQDGDSFITAVWTESDDKDGIADWIASYKSSQS